MNPGQESLAFMMASAGYDVWIGNTRSSNYTYGHISYTRKDKVTRCFSFSLYSSTLFLPPLSLLVTGELQDN